MIISTNVCHETNCRVFSYALSMLEPYEVKVSRTVLGGLATVHGYPTHQKPRRFSLLLFSVKNVAFAKSSLASGAGEFYVMLLRIIKLFT